MSMRLKIVREENPIHPRDEYDCIGTMVCWHRRYELGDEQPKEDPQEWHEAFIALYPDAIILPLYLYEHSGITMQCAPFSDRWDSGQVGWIYCTRETLDREWPAEYPPGSASEDKRKIDEARIANAETFLRAEVALYNAYLTGDCWGFRLFEVKTCDLGHEHEEETDSCWGFFGPEGVKEAIGDYLPDEAKPLLDAAWEARE